MSEKEKSAEQVIAKHKGKGKKVSVGAKLLHWLELPLVIFWLELVFHISTQGGVSANFLLYGILFSLAYGGLLEFIISFLPKRKLYYVVKAVLIGLLPILMLVLYFVYCKFNIYYDLNTLFGGAGGAIGEFGGDIVRLIFCFNGISHIILFYLPLILYLVFHKRILAKIHKAKKLDRFVAAVATVGCYLLALFMIMLNGNLWENYKTQYNFNLAIQNFGLYTGVRLDAKELMFGKSSSYDIASENANVDWTTQVEETTEGTESSEPVVYGYNVTDIDFTALAESTSDDALAAIDTYVASLQPTKQNQYTGMFEGKNLIFITAEAFTGEAIDKDLTPTLYRMATKGINFTDYYAPASSGTTGGEYCNILGMLPSAGGKSMKQTANNLNYMTMGSLLNQEGYWGKMYHNNTYTFYSRDVTHFTLGYSEGFMGVGNGMEDLINANIWPQSDLEMVEGTVSEYIDQDHFNVYYMSVSGHSDYGYDLNSMSRKNWDAVENLDYSEPVKAYLAANIELDKAMEYLISALEDAGKADDTVIVIGADHFPYGLDEGGDASMPYLQELYGGQTIDNNFVRDHNRLIMWCGSLEDEEPIVVDEPTCSLDILPTLCNLFGIEYDSRLLVGRDVFSGADALVFNDSYEWKTSLGMYTAKTGFVPVDENVEIPEGYVDDMKKIVANKISYCADVLDNDYYRHVFGDN